MSRAPFVSVVIPCRNEAAHVRRVVASLLRSAHPKELLEATFVDGMSVDGTREILEEAARAHPFIRVLDNPKLTAPAALNIGIRASRGEIIVRMDAHSKFPSDYIPRCVALLRDTGAGCAGGSVVTVPNGRQPWARAVAVVTRHRFGVGNSAFRTGGPPGYADTVPCGTFPRRVFDDIGLFDERLTRNQDNELTARLRSRGYKIAFDPNIRLRYWNQPSLKGLTRQGFYTGMWNAYTVVLHPYTVKARHFIPGAFVLYLALLAAVLASGAGVSLIAPAAFPLALYAGLVVAVSAAAGPAGGGRLRVAATVVSYHLSYGAGTHLGVVNLLTGRWRRQLGRPLRP